MPADDNIVDEEEVGIRLAETAGFCMGVKRAVDMVLALTRDREMRRSIPTVP
jgi:4-hydroxy-3-methylbut-2-enyl diphosphate reductase IspH